jgi:hypothetical protein
MCCGVEGCGGVLSEFSPEFTRQWKPQNNSGCGCGGDRNDCSKPSLARPGSPLAEWEAIYGKLITTVTVEQDGNGRMFQVVVKTACPLKDIKPKKVTCCSARYRVVR